MISPGFTEEMKRGWYNGNHDFHLKFMLHDDFPCLPTKGANPLCLQIYIDLDVSGRLALSTSGFCEHRPPKAQVFAECPQLVRFWFVVGAGVSKNKCP